MAAAKAAQQELIEQGVRDMIGALLTDLEVRPSCSSNAHAVHPEGKWCMFALLPEPCQTNRALVLSPAIHMRL